MHCTLVSITESRFLIVWVFCLIHTKSDSINLKPMASQESRWVHVTVLWEWRAHQETDMYETQAYCMIDFLLKCSPWNDTGTSLYNIHINSEKTLVSVHGRWPRQPFKRPPTKSHVHITNLTWGWRYLGPNNDPYFTSGFICRQETYFMAVEVGVAFWPHWNLKADCAVRKQLGTSVIDYHHSVET